MAKKIARAARLGDWKYVVGENLGGDGGLFGLLDQGQGGVRGLGALADPIVGASDIQLKGVVLGARVVRAEDLDRSAITTRTGFGDDHVINRVVRGADAGETDFKCHGKSFSDGLLVEKPRNPPNGGSDVKQPFHGIISE